MAYNHQKIKDMLKHIIKLIWNKKRANALLFVEIFFCFLIIFAVSTFCIKSFRAYTSPMGIQTESVWKISQPAIQQLDSAAVIEAKQLVKNELVALDGVEAVSFAGYAIPFTGSMWSWGGDEMGFEYWTSWIGGDEDLNKIYQMDLIEGRWFNKEDKLGKYEPIVINRFIREKYFEDQPMVDSIINVSDTEFKIVGVAENIRYRDGFEEELETTVRYIDEHDADSDQIILRVAAGSDASLEEAIGKVIAQTLKTEDYTITYMQRDKERIARETWIPIVILMTIGGFLIINVALGLFGVLFYTISKRRGEIGIRRAMGAFRSEVTRQFTLEVYFVAFAAMALGILLAIQVPVLGLIDPDFGYVNIYYGILFTFVLISIVVLVCAYLPSHQGSNVHPALVLHEE